MHAQIGTDMNVQKLRQQLQPITYNFSRVKFNVVKYKFPKLHLV